MQEAGDMKRTIFYSGWGWESPRGGFKTKLPLVSGAPLATDAISSKIFSILET